MHNFYKTMFPERCMAVPAMFAPAHELGRYIHIVNAYCREAAYLHDPMTSSLWYLLDLLIETHSAIAPKSLFAGWLITISLNIVTCFNNNSII